MESSEVERIQKRTDEIYCPLDICQIPLKIASNFSGFTGQQWKNWVELFSLIALQDILMDDNLECWRHFVLASRLISKTALTVTEVLIADALLLQFCRRSVRLYGTEIATPNMHLHAHICECIWTMDLFTYFGCSHLKGLTECWGGSQTTIRV